MHGCLAAARTKALTDAGGHVREPNGLECRWLLVRRRCKPTGQNDCANLESRHWGYLGPQEMKLGRLPRPVLSRIICKLQSAQECSIYIYIHTAFNYGYNHQYHYYYYYSSTTIINTTAAAVATTNTTTTTTTTTTATTTATQLLRLLLILLRRRR